MSEASSALLIAWLLAPLLAAFSAALLPSLARPLALLSALATAALGLALIAGFGPWSMELIGPLGVLLQFDEAAAPFVLLNGWWCWRCCWMVGARACQAPFWCW